MPQHFIKTPSELLDYTINWRDTSDDTFDPLFESGETIVTSTWAAETGITIGTPVSTNTTTTSTVWVSGGTTRQKEYAVTNTVVTSAGRTYQRSLYFKIEERR
jgi:hypothetical protein